MTHRRILVAGIGNIFSGDDAFGVAVAERMWQRPQVPDVRVHDFGIRGLDLAYSLLEGFEVVILVDACPRGEAPGTLFVIEPKIDSKEEVDAHPDLIDAHGMDPVKMLRLAASLGAPRGRILLVGCEPHPPDASDFSMEMSPPVAAAVDRAVAVIDEMIADFRQEWGAAGAAATLESSSA